MNKAINKILYQLYDLSNLMIGFRFFHPSKMYFLSYIVLNEQINSTKLIFIKLYGTTIN